MPLGWGKGRPEAERRQFRSRPIPRALALGAASLDICPIFPFRLSGPKLPKQDITLIVDILN